MAMHELSIAESVVDAVLERTGERHVGSVRLQVGRLSGVVPEALLFCFELAAEGTALEGAELLIEERKGLGHCRACSEDFALEDLVVLCACGSADVEVVAGRELQITSVEVV
jgi:hydrogenase nickel incorporation protein HypA/HybF